MCGIAGIVRWAGLAPGDEEVVARMTASLAHRGPDGHGVEVRSHAAFGHRRLAVVDLSDHAAQPMQTADGHTLLSYNGEIYDHAVARAELERRGVAFRSHSDTEVVLQAFATWGEAAVDRLSGMFALAVWDERKRRLILARDRYGQKPLYYARTPDGGLAFASELRALELLPGPRPEVDRRALAKYLVFDSYPGTSSALVGVRKLPPGCTLVWEEGRVRVRRYWRRRYGHSRISADEAQGELWRLLTASVERHLMSDVPLGVFLSGGVDSSAILAAMTAVTDPKRIDTFAIGFPEASYDESWAARMVAEHLGVRHHVQVLDERRLLELLPEVLDHMDEPLADASIVPTYALCKFAREHVTVALGGDGGDELFAGYDTFLAERFARPLALLPGPLRRAAANAADRFPVTRHRRSLAFLAGRFLRGLHEDVLMRSLRWFGSFLPEEASDLVIGAPEPEELLEDLEQLELPPGEPAALELWTGWYLPDDVLTKVDRASMAVSLEVRAPLLDPEVASFAHGLPHRFKVHGLERKWIFKRALAQRLPPEILARRKQGFSPPNGEWLRGPLREEVERLLAPARLEAGGLLRPEPVARLLVEHMSGARDHRKKLWALYILQRWLARRG